MNAIPTPPNPEGQRFHPKQGGSPDNDEAQVYDLGFVTSMVAGAGFEPATFGL